MADMAVWVILALVIALAELTFLTADKAIRLYILYKEAARIDGNQRRNLKLRIDAGTATPQVHDELRSLRPDNFWSRLAYAYILGMRG